MHDWNGGKMRRAVDFLVSLFPQASQMRILRIVPFVSAAGMAVLPVVVHSQDAAPRLSVMTFQSPEQGLGAKAADALRTRLAHDFSDKQLDVVQTDEVQRALQQSSFPPDDPLDPGNEGMLAHVVEAQYYITGIVTHTAGSYQLYPKLVLTRDPSLTQPLTAQSGRDIDATVAPVSKLLRAAMKEMSAEQQCRAAIHDGKPQQALTAAQTGIAVYPQGTLVRLCALDVYWGTLYPHATTHADSLLYADSALALSRAIVAIDSSSVQPLRAEAELYTVTGDSAHAQQALLGLLHAEPGNTTMANQVINSLAAMRDTIDAVRLTGELLNKNPDDPQTLQTAFLVYVHTHQWPLVTKVGTRLTTLDTAAADSTYFLRMAAAYEAQNQPQQAITILQQGTTKFSNSATLWQLYAQDLRQAGQTADADAALKRAVALNPKMSVALLQLADAYLTNHQPDSAYAMLQQATTAPDADKALIGKTAFAQGARLYQNATGPASRADYQEALKFFQLSNQLAPSTDAQFLGAASSFAIMQSAVQEATNTKSCPLARMAEHASGEIQAGLTAGAADPKYQASAAQMTQALPQLRTAITGEVKKFCR
jgi:tetratricopeptide (TPR) repeat protein